VDRQQLLDEVDAYAERLVAIGDMEAFEEVFGSSDPDFDISRLTTAELREIHDEYIADDGK